MSDDEDRGRSKSKFPQSLTWEIVLSPRKSPNALVVGTPQPKSTATHKLYQWDAVKVRPKVPGHVMKPTVRSRSMPTCDSNTQKGHAEKHDKNGPKQRSKSATPALCSQMIYDCLPQDIKDQGGFIMIKIPPERSGLPSIDFHGGSQSSLGGSVRGESRQRSDRAESSRSSREQTELDQVSFRKSRITTAVFPSKIPRRVDQRYDMIECEVFTNDGSSVGSVARSLPSDFSSFTTDVTYTREVVEKNPGVPRSMSIPLSKRGQLAYETSIKRHRSQLPAKQVEYNGKWASSVQQPSVSKPAQTVPKLFPNSRPTKKQLARDEAVLRRIRPGLFDDSKPTVEVKSPPKEHKRRRSPKTTPVIDTPPVERWPETILKQSCYKKSNIPLIVGSWRDSRRRSPTSLPEELEEKPHRKARSVAGNESRIPRYRGLSTTRTAKRDGEGGLSVDSDLIRERGGSPSDGTYARLARTAARTDIIYADQNPQSIETKRLSGSSKKVHFKLPWEPCTVQEQCYRVHTKVDFIPAKRKITITEIIDDSDGDSDRGERKSKYPRHPETLESCDKEATLRPSVSPEGDTNDSVFNERHLGEKTEAPQLKVVSSETPLPNVPQSKVPSLKPPHLSAPKALSVDTYLEVYPHKTSVPEAPEQHRMAPTVLTVPVGTQDPVSTQSDANMTLNECQPDCIQELDAELAQQEVSPPANQTGSCQLPDVCYLSPAMPTGDEVEENLGENPNFMADDMEASAQGEDLVESEYDIQNEVVSSTSLCHHYLDPIHNTPDENTRATIDPVDDNADDYSNRTEYSDEDVVGVDETVDEEGYQYIDANADDEKCNEETNEIVCLDEVNSQETMCLKEIEGKETFDAEQLDKTGNFFEVTSKEEESLDVDEYGHDSVDAALKSKDNYRITLESNHLLTTPLVYQVLVSKKRIECTDQANTNFVLFKTPFLAGKIKENAIIENESHPRDQAQTTQDVVEDGVDVRQSAIVDQQANFAKSDDTESDDELLSHQSNAPVTLTEPASLTSPPDDGQDMGSSTLSAIARDQDDYLDATSSSREVQVFGRDSWNSLEDRRVRQERNSRARSGFKTWKKMSSVMLSKRLSAESHRAIALRTKYQGLSVEKERIIVSLQAELDSVRNELDEVRAARHAYERLVQSNTSSFIARIQQLEITVREKNEQLRTLEQQLPSVQQQACDCAVQCRMEEEAPEVVARVDKSSQTVVDFIPVQSVAAISMSIRETAQKEELKALRAICKQKDETITNMNYERRNLRQCLCNAQAAAKAATAARAEKASAKAAAKAAEAKVAAEAIAAAKAKQVKATEAKALSDATEAKVAIATQRRALRNCLEEPVPSSPGALGAERSREESARYQVLEDGKHENLAQIRSFLCEVFEHKSWERLNNKHLPDERERQFAACASAERSSTNPPDVVAQVRDSPAAPARARPQSECRHGQQPHRPHRADPRTAAPRTTPTPTPVYRSRVATGLELLNALGEVYENPYVSSMHEDIDDLRQVLQIIGETSQRVKAQLENVLAYLEYKLRHEPSDSDAAEAPERDDTRAKRLVAGTRKPDVLHSAPVIISTERGNHFANRHVSTHSHYN